jgi:hypothetical protein
MIQFKRKHIGIGLLAMAFGTNAFSQITIDEHINPEIGDSAKIISTNWKHIANSTGEQVWKFNDLATTDTSMMYVKSSSAGPMGKAFPNANISMHIDTTSYYYHIDKHGQKLCGVYQKKRFQNNEQILKINYPSSLLTLSIPLNYGDSIQTSANGSISIHQKTDSLKGNRSVTTNTKYTGYGKVILPDTTYPQTACIEINQTVRDTFFHPMGLLYQTTKAESYNWFTTKTFNGVLSFIKNTIHTNLEGMSATTSTIKQAYLTSYYPSTFISISKTSAGNSSLDIFPNPVSRKLHCRFNLSAPKKITICLRNLDGRLTKHLYRGRLKKGNHSFTFHLKNVPAGCYILQAGKTRKKVIVQ